MRSDDLNERYHRTSSRWYLFLLRFTDSQTRTIPEKTVNALAFLALASHVTRNQAKWRHVLNEDEVLHLLAAHGFQTVALESLPLAGYQQDPHYWHGADHLVVDVERLAALLEINLY